MSLPRDVNAALARYRQSLEDLTFNSKPLIDDLTRAAGQLEPRGNQIIEMIRNRIMKVARGQWTSFLSCYTFVSLIARIYFYYFVVVDSYTYA